jgi:hypothetical protein
LFQKFGGFSGTNFPRFFTKNGGEEGVVGGGSFKLDSFTRFKLTGGFFDF